MGGDQASVTESAKIWLKVMGPTGFPGAAVEKNRKKRGKKRVSDQLLNRW